MHPISGGGVHHQVDQSAQRPWRWLTTRKTIYSFSWDKDHCVIGRGLSRLKTLPHSMECRQAHFPDKTGKTSLRSDLIWTLKVAEVLKYCFEHQHNYMIQIENKTFSKSSMSFIPGCNRCNLGEQNKTGRFDQQATQARLIKPSRPISRHPS